MGDDWDYDDEDFMYEDPDYIYAEESWTLAVSPPISCFAYPSMGRTDQEPLYLGERL